MLVIGGVGEDTSVARGTMLVYNNYIHVYTCTCIDVCSLYVYACANIMLTVAIGVVDC